MRRFVSIQLSTLRGEGGRETLVQIRTIVTTDIDLCDFQFQTIHILFCSEHQHANTQASVNFHRIFVTSYVHLYVNVQRVFVAIKLKHPVTLLRLLYSSVLFQ